MKLPKVIYVRIVKEQEGQWYLMAYPDLKDCVEDGEVNVIGTYWLKDSQKYEKVVSARE